MTTSDVYIDTKRNRTACVIIGRTNNEKPFEIESQAGAVRSEISVDFLFLDIDNPCWTTSWLNKCVAFANVHTYSLSLQSVSSWVLRSAKAYPI